MNCLITNLGNADSIFEMTPTIPTTTVFTRKCVPRNLGIIAPLFLIFFPICFYVCSEKAYQVNRLHTAFVQPRPIQERIFSVEEAIALGIFRPPLCVPKRLVKWVAFIQPSSIQKLIFSDEEAVALGIFRPPLCVPKRLVK